MASALVELIEIHKSFGETRALAGASLTAHAGEIHAIVGENGSGKSTLAKIISGVFPPDSGRATVAGQQPETPAKSRAAGIATIFQEVMVAEQLSVWENIFAGADGFWRRNTSTVEKKRISREMIERLALVDVDPNALVSTLPLSIKQWIVIARAIIQQPKVLIFDESSAALDLDSTNRLHKEMLALKAGGSCILIVTHRIAELIKIADRATILRDGVSVGCLAKDQMTEENILRMMSAASDHNVRTPANDGSAHRHRAVAMKASGLRLGTKSPQFEFEIETGEIVGIAGLEGAGQAEFVSILAGILPSFGAEIQVLDKNGILSTVQSLEAAEALGVTYISGDRKREGIFPNLSIIENFGLALRNRIVGKMGLIPRDKVRRVFDVERSNLGIKFGRLSDKITTLSGGNQQKVLIARAFALEPQIIILNDPARGVDIGTKQNLYASLRAFADKGGAVIYLSSEIEEFFDFADRVEVFFQSRPFASMTGAHIDEDHILGAMFGQAALVGSPEHTTGEVKKCARI